MNTKVQLTRLDGYTLSLLDALLTTEHGRALSALIEARKNEEQTEVSERPKVDNEDLSRDFRYKLGYVRALDWVLAIPETSRNLLRTKGSGNQGRG